jgi:hypothetical protein
MIKFRKFTLFLLFITGFFLNYTFSQGFKVCESKIFDPSGTSLL